MQLADDASTWYPVMRLRSGRRYILTKDSIDDPHGMRDLCTCTWVMYHLHVHVHGTCTCTWVMYHLHVHVHGTCTMNMYQLSGPPTNRLVVQIAGTRFLPSFM